jgi:predicted CopG family antitoxin
MEKTITITREEYERLRELSEIDSELLQQFLESFKDIKKGNFRRVK